MAQVTTVETFVDAKVEMSADGGPWTNISGYANSVTKEGFDRIVGQAHTYDGEYAIIGVGKINPGSVRVRLAYTEGANDPFTVVWTAYQNKTRLQVRYWPEGGTTGDFGFCTDNDSRVIDPPMPEGGADTADPIFFEFAVRSSKLIKSSAT